MTEIKCYPLVLLTCLLAISCDNGNQEHPVNIKDFVNTIKGEVHGSEEYENVSAELNGDTLAFNLYYKNALSEVDRINLTFDHLVMTLYKKGIPEDLNLVFREKILDEGNRDRSIEKGYDQNRIKVVVEYYQSCNKYYDYTKYIVNNMYDYEYSSISTLVTHLYQILKDERLNVTFAKFLHDFCKEIQENDSSKFFRNRMYELGLLEREYDRERGEGVRPIVDHIEYFLGETLEEYGESVLKANKDSL